jgi:hypothetical protein
MPQDEQNKILKSSGMQFVRLAKVYGVNQAF